MYGKLRVVTIPLLSTRPLLHFHYKTQIYLSVRSYQRIVFSVDCGGSHLDINTIGIPEGIPH